MLSLNQIVEIIKTQAESHAQINTFYFGDPWEFGASAPITYPFCGAVLDSSTYADNILTTNIRLFVCDLVHKDENNETEVLSDSRQVLLDVFSLIDDYLYDLSGVVLSENITINHFTERFDDEVSGVEATISFTQFYNKDTCQIPLKS